MRFSILAVFLLGQAAFGSTIVFNLAGGTSGSEGGLLAVSWTQIGAYTDVSIGANLAAANGLPGTDATGTAFLMKQIGSGTTAAEEIASAPISVFGNPGTNAMTSLFSSLSLDAGTYDLVIDPSDVNSIDSLDWDGAGTPTQTLGSGVSNVMSFMGASTTASFAPANTFASDNLSHIFEVQGTPGTQTPTATPEPSTTILIGCGLAVLAITRVRRSKKQTA